MGTQCPTMRAVGAKAWRAAFTLVELLVVIAIVALLAGLLLPSLARARRKGDQAECLGNLRQVGMALSMHVDENNQRFPDRRDLKTALPGGWRPWNSWPASDPRAGWAAVVLTNHVGNPGVWSCAASRKSPFSELVQIVQRASESPDAAATRYWMWRFDRPDDPVAQDNFWGKREDQAVADLQAANNPAAGVPTGPTEVELAVDGYFPGTIPSVDASLRGRAVHPGGRNRLFLDGHAAFFRDARTSR